MRAAVGPSTAAVVVQWPNFLGNLEPLDKMVKIIHEVGALAVVSADPVACAFFKPPGDCGADVVVVSFASAAPPQAPSAAAERSRLRTHRSCRLGGIIGGDPGRPLRVPILGAMKPTVVPVRRSPMRIAAIVAVGIALIGVAMAETHTPVALEPDAPRVGGASVATFALG